VYVLCCPGCDQPAEPLFCDGIEYRRWPSSPDYWAGADGSIIGMSGRRLVTTMNGPYLSITPIVDGRKVMRNVHVIVAEAWHGPAPSPHHQVAHLDGVGTNCWPVNLAWKTPAENNAHKEAHGTARVGVTNPKAKLTWQLVDYIRDQAKHGRRGADLAREIGVDKATVYAVINRETWVRPGGARTVGSRRRWAQAQHMANAAPGVIEPVVDEQPVRHAAWCPAALTEDVVIEGVRFRRWPIDPRFLCGEDASVIGLQGRRLRPYRYGRYLYVALGRRHRQRLLHRVIAEAWLGPAPPGKPQVLHGPLGSLDDRPTNLRWGTCAENMADKHRDGTHVCGERQWMALLTAAQVVAVREAYASGRGSQSDLAHRYGVTREAIRAVVTGRTWAHVGGPLTPDGRVIRTSTCGDAHHSSRLTTDIVRAIRREYGAGGVSLQALGDRYGVSAVAIGMAVRRKTWAHVLD